MQHSNEQSAELHIKTKEPEFEAVMIITPARSAFDDLRFAKAGQSEITWSDDHEDGLNVVATCGPDVIFDPSRPLGQRFRFDTTRADELQEFRDRIAETRAIIKRILGANDGK